MPHTREPWKLRLAAIELPPAPKGSVLMYCEDLRDPNDVIAVIVSHRDDTTRANAELLVRAPRLARVLKQLHYELSPLHVPPENAELSFTWRQACALVAELEKAGVL